MLFRSWENEAHLIVEQLGKGKFEIVVPSFSILAQPPVAIVDRSVDKNGKREVAQEYLNYLYSPQAQEIIAQHYYRPINEDILAKYQNIFPALELVDISFFNGWQEAHNIHFSDGGEFDKIYSNIKR